MDALHSSRGGSRLDCDRGRLEPAESAARAPREGLGPAGRGHLGGAGRPPALHPLQGHGLGRVRPRRSRAVEEFGLDGPVERWRSLRDKIHAEVCARGFDRRSRRFVQAFGSQHLDASLLLIPIVGLPAARRPAGPRDGRGDRARADAGRLRASLRHRTRQRTACRPARAPFSPAASGWLRRYALQGRQTEAEALFERLLALRNDVGLLAEEYDPKAKTFLGNFPQALSHLALANAAHQIAVGGPHRAPASLSP